MVPELGGTITVVVLRCGAGGLLLLMQPDSEVSTQREASQIFISISSKVIDRIGYARPCRTGRLSDAPEARVAG